MNKYLFKNIDDFFNKHKVIPIIIIILILFLVKLIPALIESNKPITRDYSKTNILHAINLNPDILEFNEENKAILKMDLLYKGFDTDNGNYAITPIYNDNFDQCAGYVVVTKNNETFDVDISHMCDMLDY